MLILLKGSILLFSFMELANILIMYFKPNFPYGNSMNTFKQWYKLQEDKADSLFIRYMVNWVANCKLIFLALLLVVVLFGDETITVGAVIATILSIGIYFITLHPIISRLDELGEIQPKGYSKTLAATIGGFMIMFILALIFYLIL